MKEMKDIIVL